MNKYENIYEQNISARPIEIVNKTYNDHDINFYG